MGTRAPGGGVGDAGSLADRARPQDTARRVDRERRRLDHRYLRRGLRSPRHRNRYRHRLAGVPPPLAASFAHGRHLGRDRLSPGGLAGGALSPAGSAVLDQPGSLGGRDGDPGAGSPGDGRFARDRYPNRHNRGPIPICIGSLEFLLLSPPALLMVAILGVIAFLLAGWRVALFTVLGLLFVISLDLWEAAMQTLALVLAATVVALAIGIPIGIIAAKSSSLETAIRPVLDVAQTMPAFVYLVPIVVLLGIGAGPALIATVVFAMPPAVRLTMLGIQQVPRDAVEAAHAFGATPWQTLFKVELPLSLKTIMAGVNQVIMLSLSMVVIAGLAGAGGLGEPVVTGLSQLNVGISFVGGVGIVVIAIMLDRITRALARQDRESPWRIFSRGKRPESGATEAKAGLGLSGRAAPRVRGRWGWEVPRRGITDPVRRHRRTLLLRGASCRLDKGGIDDDDG